MHEGTLGGAHLRCLVALVEESGVTRAAARLGLTQPAVSHALARLRSTFDDPLLVRASGRMVATPRALALAERARAILHQVDALAARAAPFDASSSTETFVISAPEYVEHILCLSLSRLLRREAPRARLRVKPPDPLRAERQLTSGELDLRLGWVRDPSPQMRSRVLFTDDFVCLLRRDHPDARTPLTLERYAALSHIRAQSAMPSTASRLIDEAASRIGARLHVPLVVPSHLTIGHVIAGSDLVATVPRCIARSLVRHLPLRMLASPVRIPTLRVAMYWHERVHKDPRHRWLRDVIVRAAGDLRWQSPG